MKEDLTIPEFKLFGGPLQRLGRRIGLVRGFNTFWLGVALALLTWCVLAVLVFLQGLGSQVFSLSMVGAHVRFLVAIPLFFLCETLVAPRMAEFVRDIVRSGVVPEKERPALAEVVQRVDHMKDPWLAEILILLAVVASIFLGHYAGMPGRTGNLEVLLTESGGRVGPVLAWYMWFCLPLFRFLLLRWIWHLGLWCYFLWRVQRLDLKLVPTHPDRAAGLGYLEVVQEHFGTLAAAISAVLAASFAEEISSGSVPFESLYGLIPAVFLVVAVLFVGPLFIVSQKLWACRVNGWREYMIMATRYVHAFDHKWIRDEKATGESQLGTGDLQSLADLGNSVNVVRETRLVPVSRRLLLSLAAAVLVPLLPLVLLKYPVDELMAKLFQALTGL